jgi:hypothetical protein
VRLRTQGQVNPTLSPLLFLSLFLTRWASSPLFRAQAAAEHLEKKNAIQADNVGHKLLQKMGWKEGEGIGAAK